MDIDRELTEAERTPLLTKDGAALLQRMLEHERTPRFTHRCGDRLTAEGLRRVKDFEKGLRAAKKGWRAGEVPTWVESFARDCSLNVPLYRRNGTDSNKFLQLPTVTRADLATEPWSFVPDHQPLDDLIFYGTSGTSGHPIKVLSHPEVSSKYLALLKAALGLHGIDLNGGAQNVSIVLVCAQNYTYTYASISSLLGGAGFLKLNLNPLEWKEPSDREKFLDDMQPEVYSGDPISLYELSKLSLKHRPKALVSSAMALSDGWKDELEKHFGCPVIDLYSSNECRLMAAKVMGGHSIVPHDLFVEILDENGVQCAEGERGEITITCPRNPFLPLVRYRTGDYASLKFTTKAPLLIGLEGRPPTQFVTTTGTILNNVDISFMLYAHPIAQYKLHQNADRGLSFSHAGVMADEDIRKILLDSIRARAKTAYRDTQERCRLWKSKTI